MALLLCVLGVLSFMAGWMFLLLGYSEVDMVIRIRTEFKPLHRSKAPQELLNRLSGGRGRILRLVDPPVGIER